MKMFIISYFTFISNQINYIQLQGVVRKTVSDDLVENIWEATHMDKIVPSLLYNMQVIYIVITLYS